MQIGIDLQGPFSYSLLPIIILLIFILLLTIYLLFKKYKKNKVVSNIESKKNLIININSIKNKYIKELNDLEYKFDNKEITNRRAYQSLSMIIRLFVYELTGLEVHKCTLTDIKKLNIPILYELVKEYYDPEFARLSRGNIKASIGKTKEVILRWN